MRCSTLRLRVGVLAALIDAVSTHRVELGPEDVYKMCALLKAREDTLLLQTNHAFLRGIHTQYEKMNPDTVTPFQRSFIDGTFAALPVDLLGRSSSSTSASLTPSSVDEVVGGIKCAPATDISGKNRIENGGDVLPCGTSAGASTLRSHAEPVIEERISAIWQVVQEYQSSNFIGTDGVQKIRTHCKALELQLRQMKPFEVVSLVRALATVHYQDYTFTNLLARRSCEVASRLSTSELCRTYFNLSKLHSHDSMVAFVNQIEAHMETLHLDHLNLVTMALERQPQISSAPARMVPKLLTRAVSLLHETDNATYHRALLIVAARYNQRRHPAVAKIFCDSSRHLENIAERDVFAILQSAVDLELPSNTPGLVELLGKTTAVVDTMEIRNLDALIDILSVLPVDTSGIMAKLMDRLTVDGGRLSVPQMTFTLDLLSSYPPAKGHGCIAALAFATSLRSESFDGEALEQVVLSLAQLQHFSDEFYMLVATLQSSKGGFRAFDKLAILMKCCTKEVVADVRGQKMIATGILGLAPTMNDAELAESRRLLMQLGVDDKNVHQMIFRRAKQLQREAGGRWARRNQGDADELI